MKIETLNNGVKIPYIGLGTYRMDNDAETIRFINAALGVGYRHIDTAMYYHNEEAVGKAIKQSSVPREQIFVTTKLWNDDIRTGKVIEAFDTSLKKLGFDYIDLYLIHWPVGNYINAWKALRTIYESGRAKAIGVSNFNERQLNEIIDATGFIPAVNQVECHPYLNQEDTLQFCTSKGIKMEAWSPLGAAKLDILENPVILDMAEKYNKSAAQIVLRWDIDRNVIVIPKSSHKERLEENINIFDFSLKEEEINSINSLNKNYRTGADPENVPF